MKTCECGKKVSISVDDAISVISRDYFDDVRAIATELAKEHIDPETLEPKDDSDLNDVLHEAVDGTQRVIYTWQARLGMLVTDNPDAWGDTYPTVEQQMFCAMEADIRDYLSNEYFLRDIFPENESAE